MYEHFCASRWYINWLKGLMSRGQLSPQTQRREGLGNSANVSLCSWNVVIRYLLMWVTIWYSSVTYTRLCAAQSLTDTEDY